MHHRSPSALFHLGAPALVLGAALAPIASSQTLDSTFRSPDDASWRYFGNDVAIDGDTIVVGGNGFVEIWDRSGPNATYRETLVTPNPSPGSYGFGRSVDAANGIIIVGALGEDVSGASTGGRAYLYRDIAGSYALIDTITSGAEFGQFGWDVDLSSDGASALVSAPGESKVYWYESSGGRWDPVHEATFSSTGGGRGTSLSIEGDSAFIGDPYRDRVRCYERAGGAWSRTQSVGDGGLSGGQQFGWSVDSSGRWLVVGMPYYEPSGSSLYLNSGGAQIFENVGGTWTHSFTWEPVDWTQNIQTTFGGWSVSVEGDTVAIGAYGRDSVSQSAGVVDVLTYDGSTWNRSARLEPESGAPFFHFFGTAVHLEAGTLLVGADGNAGTGLSYNGQVYVYRVDIERGTPYCGPAVSNSSGAPAEIIGFGNVRVADDEFQLRASSLPPQVFGFFLASRSQGFVANPGGSQGNLCLGGGIGRMLASVQNSGAAGTLAFDVDLTAVAQPTGPVGVVAGETWNFQAWFRDANPTLTSNYSNGVEVTFQ